MRPPRAALLHTIEMLRADLDRGDIEAARALLDAHVRALETPTPPDCWSVRPPRRDS